MIILQKDENIVSTVRKHWIVFAVETTGIIVSTLLPLVVVIAGLILADFTAGNAKLFYAGTFLYSLWLIFMWLWFFMSWTDYYLDSIIITNKQVIDIDQKGLFNRETSNFDINRIQDVTVDVNGFFATVFDFGDLHIQTASDEREFILHNAANPHQAKELIMKNSSSV